MIVDTSAIVSIAKAEPSAPAVLAALTTADSLAMSAGTWMELFIVLDRNLDPATVGRIEQLMQMLDIQIVDVTAEQAALSRTAYRRFGKGNHPAGLNFGDCFAYALARDTAQALLFVGEDFAQTDIAAAV